MTHQAGARKAVGGLGTDESIGLPARLSRGPGTSRAARHLARRPTTTARRPTPRATPHHHRAPPGTSRDAPPPPRATRTHTAPVYAPNSTGAAAPGGQCGYGRRGKRKEEIVVEGAPTAPAPAASPTARAPNGQLRSVSGADAGGGDWSVWWPPKSKANRGGPTPRRVRENSPPA